MQANHLEVCHVCGMTVQEQFPSYQYHNMYFHFCSKQCRDNFIAHPSLYSVQVNEKPILKHRTITLAAPLEQHMQQSMKTGLMEMMGIKQVEITDNNISMTYDLLQVSRRQIENKLAEIGIKIGHNWLERLKRAWVYDSEENELDNLAAPIHYYHRPVPKK